MPSSNSPDWVEGYKVKGLYIRCLEWINIGGEAWGAVMPIYEFLKRQGSFEPEEVTMLGQVFEDVLKKLRLVDRKDPMTEMVAKKLVELATAGMREPERLKALTIQAFTQQQQQQVQRKVGRREHSSSGGV